MGGGGTGDSRTTTIQDIPREFKPAFTSLFNSAFGAGRQAAGQGSWSYPYVAPQYADMAMGAQTPNQMWAQMLNQGATQAGNAALQPQGMGFYPGVNMGNPQSQGTSLFNTAINAFNPNQGLPSNWQQGNINQYSPQIPLATGPPIVGQPYPGAFTAPTNPLEVQSLAQREQIGNQLAGLGNPLLGLGQFTAQGGFLNPQSNPFLQQAISYALQPAVSEFTGSVLPAFESQALQAGGFKGSSARDMALAQMTDQFGRNLLGTAATIGYGDYANERQLQQNAGQLLDQAARLQQLSPEILAQTGAGARELQQRLLNEQLLRFQEMQQAPFRPLGPLASIIQGSNIGGTSFSEMNQGTQISPLGGGIAGALGGAGLGANVGNLFGQAGWGAGLGGLLGAAAGAFG